MIGSLRGRILERSSEEVLLEVGGVGYRVSVSARTLRETLGEGAELLLYVHHYNKAETESLYGFASVGERRLFEALLEANRVGPSLAMSIMDTHNYASLQRLLANADVDALTLVPGIGVKTAQRLLVELQACLDVPGLSVAAQAAAPAASGLHADLREALVGLGYRPERVQTALAGLPDEGDEAELLRLALQRLGGAA